MNGLHFQFESIVMKAVREKLRNGSIKMLKGYLQLVRGVRSITLAFAALAALSAAVVGGALIAIIGLIGLIPMAPQTFFIVLAALGFVVFALSGLTMYGLFRERRWMEGAKVHELMELALHNAWVEPSKSAGGPESRPADDLGFSSTVVNVAETILAGGHTISRQKRERRDRTRANLSAQDWDELNRETHLSPLPEFTPQLVP